MNGKKVTLQTVIGIIILGNALLHCHAVGFEDIDEIKTTAVSRAATLYLTPDQVQSNYNVSWTETSNKLFKMYTTDTLGPGTNCTFYYTVGGTQKLRLVECRDQSANGMDYGYYWNGHLSTYVEYQAGALHGVYLKLYTNSQVQAFANISNNYFVGEGYRFNSSGAVIEAVTSSVPQLFGYQKEPPQATLQARVTMKPEALEVSPGILTAFVRLPAGYPVSGITSATCDGAPAERMMPSDDGSEMIIKFRRQDIEAALRRNGQSIDIHFVVRGTWQDTTRTLLFQGADSITKIVEAKDKDKDKDKRNRTTIRQ